MTSSDEDVRDRELYIEMASYPIGGYHDKSKALRHVTANVFDRKGKNVGDWYLRPVDDTSALYVPYIVGPKPDMLHMRVLPTPDLIKTILDYYTRQRGASLVRLLEWEESNRVFVQNTNVWLHGVVHSKIEYVKHAIVSVGVHTSYDYDSYLSSMIFGSELQTDDTKVIIDLDFKDMARLASNCNNNEDLIVIDSIDNEKMSWYLRPHGNYSAAFEVVYVDKNAVHRRVYPTTKLRSNIEELYGRFLYFDETACLYYQRGNTIVDQSINAKLRYVYELVKHIISAEDLTNVFNQ
jgi:hypothetical protein